MNTSRFAVATGGCLIAALWTWVYLAGVNNDAIAPRASGPAAILLQSDRGYAHRRGTASVVTCAEAGVSSAYATGLDCAGADAQARLTTRSLPNGAAPEVSPEVLAMLTRLGEGDPTVFSDYTRWRHQCRIRDPQDDGFHQACFAPQLGDWDARFLDLAGLHASGDDPEAQFVLGQWWNFVAAEALNLGAVATDATQTSEASAAALIATAKTNPKFIETAQKAADWFAKAADEQGYAERYLTVLQQFGISPAVIAN